MVLVQASTGRSAPGYKMTASDSSVSSNLPNIANPTLQSEDD